MDRTRNKQSDYAADAPLDMSRLRRLALWGTAAAAMLAVAVMAGMSDTGMRRINVAMSSWGNPDRLETRMAGSPTQSSAPAPIIVQRDPEALAEARRLGESVKALTADRDRLQTRLSALERNFEDVTGSIKREISATRPVPPSSLPPIDLPSMADKPAAPPASAPAPARPAAPAKTAAAPAPEPEPAPVTSISANNSAPFLPPATEPMPPIVTTAPAPPNTANALVAMAPLDPPLTGAANAGIPSFGLPGMPALPPSPAAEPAPDVTAAAPPAAPANGATAPRIEFGVDIGGASNIEMIRAQWSMVRSQHPKLLDGLTPVVSVRDLRQRRTVELRLVAGPLSNANAAAQLCAALNAAGLPSCQPAVFDGQRLALR